MTDDPADLSHLRDIALPDPVSYWPPAPGWWILAAAVLAALAILGAKALARYRRNAYRRAALDALDAIGPRVDAAGVATISAVLKRASIVAYGRAEVAPLTGQSWLDFLDRTGRGARFKTGPAAAMPLLALGRGDIAEGEAIRGEARRWLRRHRPPKASSSEVDAGSREEDATRQDVGAVRRVREAINASKGSA